MVVRETWQTTPCRVCKLLFARTPLPLIALDVPADLCFDCHVCALVGEVCDLLVLPVPRTTIRVIGRVEHYSLMAKQSPYGHWYALGIDQHVDILNSPLEMTGGKAGPAEGRPN